MMVRLVNKEQMSPSERGEFASQGLTGRFRKVRQAVGALSERGIPMQDQDMRVRVSRCESERGISL